jgi:putative ABC transport system ATP-binding protein
VNKVVELRDVSFTYPRALKPALLVEEFSMNSGERVFLMGPSGMGKTTLLGIIAGVNVPQKGEVKVMGSDLRMLAPSARDTFRGKNIGYIFQLFNLIPYLNVFDNVLIQSDLFSTRSPELCKRAEFLLDHLGLHSEMHKPVTELSVGQQQRVAAARALVGKPAVVIADEPTSALDVQMRGAFLDALFSLCNEEKSALLFVSHDPGLQNHFDRVVLLQDLNRALQSSPSRAGGVK